MAGSYDELLDGEYIGKMRSVYKDGAKQVDDLMWQYATAEAIAQRDASIQLLATTHEISPEAAKVLYYGMAGIHTGAAMVGAIYGLKGAGVPVTASKSTTSLVDAEKAALERMAQNAKNTVDLSNKQPGNVLQQQQAKNKDSSSETYFRVEGGGSGTQTSQNRINVNSDGTVSINSGCSGQLCVSTNGSSHASYYLTNKRQDGSVVVFEVDATLHKQIMDSAVPQRPIPGVARDPNAPKIVDPTKGQPSVSLELPKVWDRLVEQNSSKARVLTKEEFFNEFGK